MPYQELDYPFSGGIDEKTQSQLVEPGSALVVNNLRQQKNGSYEKISGNTALGLVSMTGANIPEGERLIAYNDELIQTDNRNLFSRSPSTNAWKKVLGYAPQASISSISVVPLQFGVGGYDLAVSGNYAAVTYSLRTTDTGTDWTIMAAVVDLNNDAIVHGPISISGLITSGFIPYINAFTLGTKLLILWSYDAVQGSNVWGSSFDTASRATINAGWTSPTAFITDASPGGAFSIGTNVFDSTPINDTQFVVAYVNNLNFPVTSTTISVKKFNASFFLLLGGTIGASSPSTIGGIRPGAIAIAGSVADGYLWVAFPLNNTTATHVIGIDPAVFLLLASQTDIIQTEISAARRLALAVTGPGEGILTASRGFTTPSQLKMRKFNDTAGVTTALGTPNRKYFIQGDVRPFLANRSRLYGGFRFQPRAARGAEKDSLWLTDLTATFEDQLPGLDLPTAGSASYLRVMAEPFPRLAQSMPGGDEDVNGSGPHAVLLSDTKALFLMPVSRSTEGAAMELITVDFAGTNTAQPAILGEGVGMSGALPSYYDGVRSSELGFFSRPRIQSFTTSSGPLNGTFSYVAVYEQFDAKGQWHQSNVSDPFTLITGGAVSIHLSISTLQATNRVDAFENPIMAPGQVRIVLYRTTGETGTTGTVFYRVQNSEILNMPLTDTLTITDITPDSDLIGDGATFLYTQPGIPNTAQVKVNPPPFSCTAAHANRIFGASGTNLWFSGQHVSGEGPWFADLFQIPIEYGGDITALASLDGSLVVFKRDRIGIIDGEGPPDNGAGGDFGSPQFIATDVGCIEPRSVVVTPGGVLFQSLRGIEMLTRGRSLANYFGAAVEASLAANPTITSAVLDETKSTVTFTCVSSEDDRFGVELVWDLVHSFWTTKSIFGGRAAKSAVMQGQEADTVPARVWLRSDGNIYQEGGYLNAGAYVPSSIKTPWIKMAGLQGYGRTSCVALLAECPSPCDIRVDVEVDYRDGIVQSRTYTAAEIAALRIPQMNMTMQTQKVESIRFTLTDVTPTGGPAVGTGQGARFIGLRIEYMQKPKVNRLPKISD